MTDPVSSALLGEAQALVRLAIREGADYADVVAVESASLDVDVLNGALEKLEQAETRELGLRAIVDGRQAVVATRVLHPDELARAAQNAVAMAKLSPQDPHLVVTPPQEYAESFPALDLVDDAALDAQSLLAMAREAERAGLAVAGVSRSDGTGAHAADRRIGLVTSGGFAATYRKTTFSVSATMIGQGETGMERDHHWSNATHLADLEPPEAVGREAGRRAASRRNPRLVDSQRVPVVYDTRAAVGIVSHFLSAISGDSIVRGTSFLKDKRGVRIFPAGVSIVDEGLTARGLASRPFDSEGRAVRARTLLADDGRLVTWLLDNRSAAALGLHSTHHAARSPGGVPSPSAYGVTLAPGSATRETMIAGLSRGLLVTELIGMGVNGVTGDYSRGASGYWIERGEIAFPVSGITVASNLNEMFAALTPANDLTSHGRTRCPSVFVGEMMVAGA